MVSLLIDKKILFISIIKIFLAYKLYFYFKTLEKSTITIPIVIKIDNQILYPSIVTITSLIENSNKDNNYEIFILIPKNFMIDNRLKLLTLETKYKNLKIYLVESEEPYVKIRHYKSNYYKIFLPFLIQNYDKIIYLNWNTLVFEDLEQLFNMDVNNYYFLGFLNGDDTAYLNLSLKIEKSININVLIINMKKLKENNFQKEFKKLYIKYKNNKIMNEQIMINVLYQNYIGILPEIYGMPNFDNADIALEYNKKIKEIYRYEKNNFISAYYKPIVMDLICRPWELGDKCQNNEAWWYYAKKSNYYEEIMIKYGKVLEKNEG